MAARDAVREQDDRSVSGLTYPGTVPLPLRPTLGLLLVVIGVVLLAVAVLGARSRLRRNRFVGVRTAATLRSEASFALANRVAAAPTGAAGLVGVVGGGAVAAGGAGVAGWVVLAVTVPGLLVLAGLGGMLGDRAATVLVPEAPAPPGCGGVCAGCDLVTGCGDRVGVEPSAPNPGP